MAVNGVDTAGRKVDLPYTRRRRQRGMRFKQNPTQQSAQDVVVRA
jgi:hypothetical protein